MTLLPDRDAAARRLLQALAAEPNTGDHEAVQDLLPEFIEAEMAGEDAAARFPAVQTHLDSCQICSHLYAELVDVLLADEAGEIAPALELPPMRLPAPVIIRRRVREVTASALAVLGLGQAELEAGLQFVFSGLVPAPPRSSGHLVAERANSRFGAREAAAVASAAYNVMMILSAPSPVSLLSEQSSGGAPALLQRVALAEARRLNLNQNAAETFVSAALREFGRNYGELVDLAGRPETNA